MKLIPIIGIEIHVQLNTASKLFCGCSASHFGKEPNSQVCPVCLGLPGAIPSPPNREAVKKAVLVAKALDCRLAKECYFERKNYFYPDLPKGYQISQYQTAIGKEGKFSTWDEQREVRIRKVHLEEDAAKLVHKLGQTLIDFNRAGVPLLEIVTEPDLETPAQANIILRELKILFRHLKVSDADMEKGSMRLEANVSLKKEEAKSLPDYRVELKNINSFNFLVRALEKEIGRQRTLLKMGKKVVQETRGYSEKKDETFSQRRKEEAFDYRYFPEPDLPPITAKLITHRGNVILPGEQRLEFERKYHLSRQYANVLAADPELLTLFERTVQTAKELNPKEVASVIVNRRFGDPKKLKEEGLINAIKKSKEEVQISEAQIKRHIDAIILDNPKAISDYKAGKEEVIHFLLGALMRRAKGKIEPGAARRSFKERLASKT